MADQVQSVRGSDHTLGLMCRNERVFPSPLIRRRGESLCSSCGTAARVVDQRMGSTLPPNLVMSCALYACFVHTFAPNCFYSFEGHSYALFGNIIMPLAPAVCTNGVMLRGVVPVDIPLPRSRKNCQSTILRTRTAPNVFHMILRRPRSRKNEMVNVFKTIPAFKRCGFSYCGDRLTETLLRLQAEIIVSLIYYCQYVFALASSAGYRCPQEFLCQHFHPRFSLRIFTEGWKQISD